MLIIQELIKPYFKYLKNSNVDNKDSKFDKLEKCKDIKNENIQLRNSDKISSLDKIEYLDISDRNTEKLPEDLSGCKNLKVLNMSGNDIESLEQVCELTSLNILIAKKCKISSIPKNIKNLKELLILDLSENLIDSIPDEIITLPNIISLILKGNKIKSVPSDISELINLLKLDISFNKLTVLESEIWKLNNLKYLNVGNNEISDINIPATGNMLLSYLNLEHNRIEHVNESILNLKELQYLFLNNNLLKNIPSEITQLKNLERFYFKNNPFDDMPELKNIGSLNLFTYLDKINDKTYEVEWAVPKGIRTAFQQYLIYFPDFIEKQSSKQFYFDVIKTDKGFKLRTKTNSNIGIQEINDYLKQYIDILRYSKEDMLEVVEGKAEQTLDLYKAKHLVRELIREKNNFMVKINEYFDKILLLDNDKNQTEKLRGLQFHIKYFESLTNELLKIVYKNTGNVLKQNFDFEITKSPERLSEFNA